MVRDDVGQEHVDLEAAKLAAIETIRSVCSWDVQGGELCSATFIEIETDRHDLVATIHFSQAINVITRSFCDPRT